MRNLSLTTVGASCAVLLTLVFVVAIGLGIASGVETIIPETGENGRGWIADVGENRDLFLASAWLVVLAGLIGLIALVGFYDALREAGPVMIIAPVAGAVGMTLVTISHAVPIAMAYELVPGYLEADGAAQAAHGGTFDAFASVCQLMNYCGNALGWGVTVPLYAIAILRTSVMPHWIGWLGMVVAVFAGWLGLLSPASTTVEGISSIGFIAFFVFMASVGVALLLRQRRLATVASQ